MDGTRVTGRQEVPPPGRPAAGATLAVAATFTGEPIEATLRFWMRQFGRPAGVDFSAYNQVFQALLDPAGLLARGAFANVVLVRWEDFVAGDRPTSADGWSAELTTTADDLVSAVRSVPRTTPTIVVVCPPSPQVTASADVAAVLERLTAESVDRLKGVPGVYAFGPGDVAATYPVADVADAGADALGKIPYTPAYFAALGTFVARTALAARRAPYKVVVLDCDNTLWGGVCGEGGVAAVTVGPGFRAMQRFMAEQSAAGKVLCLCSKNVEADVWDVFDNHPDMLLGRDQFAAHRINWSPKGQNLAELARELNVGLDSFIFLDDNPVECAEVRSSCPEVLTLQAPSRPDDWPAFLKHVWAFDQLTVTDQDRQRAASYLQNARREEVRLASAGLEDFLANLQLEVAIAPPRPGQMSRVAQLTDRTNQFNFSTVRRTEPELLALLADGRHRCDAVTVKDRFGDYGLVGVTIVRDEPNVRVVDTMLLSCRVLGRGVEHRMLAAIGRGAGEAGRAEVMIPLVRTPKNQPAVDFLEAAVGEFRSETSAGRLEYRLPAAAAAAVTARVASAPPAESGRPSGVTADVSPAAYQRVADGLRDVAAIEAAVDAGRVPGVAAAATEYVEPQGERQADLAAIWRRVLKLPRVGIRDDYFALGGTSVLAVRLVLEVERVFGRQLPIATLLRAPTVEAMAALLGDPADADDLAMVPLKPEGTGTPLLLLPGIGGHVLKYKPMVDRLRTDRPVYGLEMRPDVAAHRQPRSLEQIAAEFVRRIETVQPHGPYLLAGWSFGGTLSVEVARQLRGAGKAVALVALFDTWANGYPRQVTGRARFRRHAERFAARDLRQNLRYLWTTGSVTVRFGWHRLLRATGIRRTDFHGYESPLIEQMVATSDAALKRYQPGRLSGTLTLIRGTRVPDLVGLSYADPHNGWAGVADRIDVYPVDADHLGLFDEPAVGQTAAALDRAIAAAVDG